MKNLFRIATRAAITALSFAGAPLLAAQLDPVPVRIIGINDFHGHLEAGNNVLFLKDPTAAAGTPDLRVNVGSAAAMSGIMKSLRAGSPFSLTIGGGDLVGASPLVSSLFRHETTIEILNEMGLDVSTVGNHEFDAGLVELQRLIKGGCAATKPADIAASCASDGRYGGAKFTYLASNVVDAQGKHPIAPYTIKTFDGIRVGIIGAVTKTTPQMVVPSGIAGLTFQDEAEAVNRAADALRALGVRSMIATFHEGIELGTNAKRGDWNDTTCPEAHGPLLDIAKRLAPEIKVVHSAHTHQGYRCEIGGRLLISGTSYARGISVVDVELDRSTGAMLPPVRSYNLPVVNERTDPAQRAKLAGAAPAPFDAVLRDAKPDASIAAKVAKFAALVAPKADRPIGRIGGAITRSGNDSSAGRLVADSQYAATKSLGAQAALMNPGGIRANFECAAPPCTVTFGQAFTMQPFGNSLVVVSYTGTQLKDMLESQWKGTSGEPRFLQPSETFTYTWTDSAAPGSRVTDLRIGGEPVQPQRKYRITVNSFLAEGGDGFTATRDGTEPVGGGQDIDALLAWLGAGDRNPDGAARINRVK
ncbi:hypothetical protein BWI17_15550 [Betaproteobacteria bacterium GR16-43]|nr:hypothetical protein BWI17_15550 [Betaproteobacteria bacterium GR16-43]